MALADPKKAKITHILRDGTVLDSIEGHVVRMEDAELMYQMFLDMAAGKVRKASLDYQNNRRSVK